MSARTDWKKIQTIIGTKQDGVPGPKDATAIDLLRSLALAEYQAEKFGAEGWTATGKASSFADPKDVAAFDRCKKTGKTDKQCFAVGDNGVGCWGDSTKEGSGMSCAVSPDYMIEKFGTVAAAKHAKIRVEAKGKQIVVTLKDRMPWRENVENGAVIDLNPDAAAALGLKPPFMVPAKWAWL